MDEDDPLIERLRGLGRETIAPGVAARHLGAIAGARVRTPRFVKLKVGTAFAAGLILGGTGLASANALPGPVQGVAHTALTQVGVSVPGGNSGHGPARYNGPECTGGPYANHGQYVRTHKSDPNAGESRCGKPVQAGNDEPTNGTEAPDTPEAPEAPENDQGDTPGAAHGNNGHHGKSKTTPSTVVTVPAPLPPATTVVPANRSKSTTTATTSTTVVPTAPTPTTTLEATASSTTSTTTAPSR